MLKIIVTVQPSGQQKEFRAVEGGAPCDVVAAVLKEEFGPGSLHPAGINTALLPLADVPLQAGSYDYRTFAGATGAGPAANTAAETIASGVTAMATAITSVAQRFSVATLSAPVTPKTVRMSNVGSRQAKEVLKQIGLTVVTGNRMYKIVAPPGGFPDIAPFPMHGYSCEVDATPDYLEYLQKHLVDAGVKFGPGGFDLVDVHANQDLLQLRTDSQIFKGYMDAVAVPYAVESYGTAMRLAIELKYTAQDKKLYERDHPDRKKRKSGARKDHNIAENAAGGMPAGAATAPSPVVLPLPREEREGFPFVQKVMGQSIVELLAAYSAAQYPLDLAITEGYTYHILRIRAKKLIVWRDLTPGQAIHHLADGLKQETCSMIDIPPLSDSTAPDEGYEALQLLQQYHPLATIREQVEQLMELDDGSSKIQQAIRAVGFMQEQHGDDAVGALVDLPFHFYSTHQCTVEGKVARP